MTERRVHVRVEKRRVETRRKTKRCHDTKTTISRRTNDDDDDEGRTYFVCVCVGE